jgi:hypothetical protein
MCGVSYGEIDVDRLINALTLVADPTTGGGEPRVGHGREGTLRARVASLRALSDVPERLLAPRGAERDGRCTSVSSSTRSTPAPSMRAPLAGFTDEGLLHAIGQRAPSALLERLRRRHCTSAPSSARPLTSGRRRRVDRRRRTLTVAVERRAGGEVGLQPGELLLDYPTKTQMLGLDLLVQRRTAKSARDRGGWEGAINLPKLSDELYHSARWLRIYTSRRGGDRSEQVIALASLSRDEFASRLDAAANSLRTSELISLELSQFARG